MLVGDKCPRLRSRSATRIKLTVLNKLSQLWIVFLHVGRQGVELVTMDMQEGRHKNNFLYLAVVVSIVEEFVETIAGFLRFCNK